ncbi:MULTISPECIES: hypothetical protein [unclassified Enterococcus]|jgi:Tfp pilus assembly protein PilV|uniref:hypothetical protein n=1 Tax=unclassified Enterococcus TaxID=2608891 RepID=UPI003D26B79B
MSKESNKSGFILLESLVALSIVTVSVHFFSRTQLFLLERQQETKHVVRLARILYEEVKAYQIHEGEQRRYRQLPFASVVELTAENGIEKAVILGESEVIRIEKIPSA